MLSISNGKPKLRFVFTLEFDTVKVSKLDHIFVCYDDLLFGLKSPAYVCYWAKSISTGAPQLSAGRPLLGAPAHVPFLLGKPLHTDAPNTAAPKQFLYTNSKNYIENT
jgi:hypothetical protein